MNFHLGVYRETVWHILKVKKAVLTCVYSVTEHSIGNLVSVCACTVDRWWSSGIWQQRQQVKIPFIQKSGADLSQGLLVIIVQNLLFSSLLSKNTNIKTYWTIILPVLYGCENWSLSHWRKNILVGWGCSSVRRWGRHLGLRGTR
jgi:hypothetical protein